MWLIDTVTLKLEYITNPRNQNYAILSHTWGDNEVTFQDTKDPAAARRKNGWQKIRKTCQRAAAWGLSYAWVDTCCIDKSSSAELSESINSMFQWYRLSKVCFAWLEDWTPGTSLDLESMRDCRWFTRGWTLQELIAPPRVEFLDHDWNFRGDAMKLGNIILSVTKIDFDIISGRRPLSQVPVGRRMSWAALRQTTREEDRAYSLMGIFGIHMPLLYGEGERAFVRLQEEIANNSADLSLFAWDVPTRYIDQQQFFGILAPSPDYFEDCSTLISQENQFHNLNNFVITNRGLSIHTSLIDCRVSEIEKSNGLPLWCHRQGSQDDWKKSLVLPLTRTALGYVRSHYGVLGWANPPFPPFSTITGPDFDDFLFDMFPSEPKQILVRKSISLHGSPAIKFELPQFISIKLPKRKYTVVHTKGFPPALWDEERVGFHLAGCTEFVGIVVIRVRMVQSPDTHPVGEVQLACGYCEEIGGSWACFVPIIKGSGVIELRSTEIHYSSLIRKLRMFNDEARENSWRGYQIIRQKVFGRSSGEGLFIPTKENMLVDEPLDWGDFKVENTDDHAEFQIGAHVECSGNTEELKGEIIVTLVDL